MKLKKPQGGGNRSKHSTHSTRTLHHQSPKSQGATVAPSVLSRKVAMLGIQIHRDVLP